MTLSPRRRAQLAANDAKRRFDGEYVHFSVYEELMALPCVKCGIVPAGGVDHIVSKRNGGHNAIDNLRPMCRADNHSKGG